MHDEFRALPLCESKNPTNARDSLNKQILATVQIACYCSFSFAAIEACKNSVKNQVPSLHNVLLTIAAVGSSACMPPSEQSYVTTQQVRKDDDDLQLNRARDSTVVAYGVRATPLEATLHLSLSLTVQYQSQGVSTFNHSNAGSYCSKVSSRK